MLIVGLGNPGDAYRNTRHNMGFEVVRAFARERGLNFRHASHLIGELAQGDVEGKKVFLLLPATFMNSSGDAVRRCLSYYQVPMHELLVVCDDIALPLGTMRIRAKGSPGGHNGLKSIAEHLNTDYYERLRIGVGTPSGQDLVDHVLGKFTSEEQPIVDKTLGRAAEVLLLYVQQGSAAAMQKANARKKLESEENQEK